MTDFETFHDSTPQRKDVHSPEPSLPIFLNLNPMFEHDERHRRSPNIYSFENVRSSTSLQSSGSPVFPTGRDGKAGSRSNSPSDFSSVGSGSTRASDATAACFPFSVSAAPQPAASNPFIDAVPLTRDVGPNGQNQSPGDSTYSPITPGIPHSPLLASDRGVDPPKSDHDLFISFRSRRTPTSTAYSMPRMERLAGRGRSIPTTPAQLESHATVSSGFSEFSEDGSSLQSAKALLDSENQKESGKTFPTPLLTSLSRAADEPTALTERRSSSKHRSHSSESIYSPVAASTQQPIGIPNTIYPSFYVSDSQNHPISGPNNTYGSHISSTSTSPSRESSIESSSSSPIFATSFEWSPTDVSRPALYTVDQSGATLNPSGRSSTSSSRPVGYRAMSSSPKPPLPTSPKPNFRRSTSANPPLNKSSRRPSPNPISHFAGQASPNIADKRFSPMPPTTNLRDPQERADLVKKNRKLAQMFGTTPGATVLSQKYESQANPSTLPSFLPFKSGRAFGIPRPSLDDNELKSSWLMPGDMQYLASGRRHSAPFSPHVSHDDMTDGHSLVSNPGTRGGVADGLASNRASMRQDLELPYDGSSNTPAGFSTHTPNTMSRRLGIQHSPSTPSLGGTSTITIAEQEDADRKRKRDQLAKLHRFLGSRVPVGLVLGLDHGDSSLPPPALQTPDNSSKPDPASRTTELRKLWLSRRRSSSADMYPMSSHDLDRLKEDLSDEEKAINVRRALKMEKVFGVLPPQDLYHTRCSPPPTRLPASPVSPSFGRWTAPPSPISQSRNQSQVFERNPNQSAYKSRSKKHDRPGTPESMQQLLPDRSSDSFYFDSQNLAVPNVYTHYQHSLHSLNDIIDRDDRASLVELHQYLQGEIPDPPFQEFGPTADSSGFVLGSPNMGRRRSLPSASISTAECNIPTAKPEATDFQLRRRRAAKLTQFFGVDYKQIIHNVLESIEKGVEEERKRGTLQPEEVEVLLQKVNTLKTKRSAIL